MQHNTSEPGRQNLFIHLFYSGYITDCFKCEIKQRRIKARLVVIKQFDRMWNEVEVAKFGIPSRHLPEEAEENHDKP
jgi:hypothetical protein